MATTFRLVPEREPIDLNFERLKNSLPASMCVLKKPDGIYVTVESTEDEDPSTQVLIDREVDRIQFLTCVKFRAEMCRRTVTATLSLCWRVHGPLPKEVRPLTWTGALALQLRLWALATEAQDSALRVLLHFQIIELSYPNTRDKEAYPPFSGGSHSPHPRTEAKLLRHLVAHAGDARTETSSYLEYLGLPSRLGNYNHPNWDTAITSAGKRVEKLARKIIRRAICQAENYRLGAKLED
ncbi:hypothetical protein [Thauera sp.]|uniref:hypothetical protein n=1 Tax=Thauera sp. TaxID=1905334 RepID=UPI0039E6FF0F